MNLTVHLEYHAQAALHARCTRESITIPHQPGQPRPIVQTAIRLAASLHPELAPLLLDEHDNVRRSLLLASDDRQIEPDQPLQPGQTIAIIPPIAGG